MVRFDTAKQAVKDPTAAGVVQVEAYLEAFAEEHGLHRHVRYNTRVVRARPVHTGAVGTTGGSHANCAANGHANGSAAADGGAALPWPRWQVDAEPSRQQARRHRWPLCVAPSSLS